MTDLEGKIKQIIEKTMKKRINFSPNDSLINLGISSLKMVLILGQIENMFDIDIPQEVLVPENFVDLATIAKTIQRIQESQ